MEMRARLCIGLLIASIGCVGRPASGGSTSTQTPPQIDQKVAASLPASVRQGIAQSPVRVLVPNVGQLLASSQLSIGNGFYSIHAQADGLTVVIQGSPVTPQTPSIVKEAPASSLIAGRRVFLSLNEGIRTASWVESSAAYSMDLECAKVQDSRCSSEDYLRGLISGLAFVGGGKQ
jgi:hypothetical protein